MVRLTASPTSSASANASLKSSPVRPQHRDEACSMPSSTRRRSPSLRSALCRRSSVIRLMRTMKDGRRERRGSGGERCLSFGAFFFSFLLSRSSEKTILTRSGVVKRILAVLVNSLYSFWWDVTNDWGLSLLTPSGWSSSPSVSYAFNNPPSSSHSSSSHGYSPLSTRQPPPPSRTTSSTHAPTNYHGRARSTLNGQLLAPPGGSGGGNLGDDPLHSTQFAPPPSRPVSPAVAPSFPPKPHTNGITPGGGGISRGHSRAFSTAAAPNLSYPFLRPILLLPDPLIYYLCIALDLLLRFTWSLKLSPHLHSAAEVEAGVFTVELMEVVRRWMWVYLRVEWEAVRKGAGGSGEIPSLGGGGGGGGGGGTQGVSWLEKDDGDARLRVQEEYELAAANAKGRYRDGLMGGDGLGGEGLLEGAELGLANGSMLAIGGKGKGREVDLL